MSARTLPGRTPLPQRSTSVAFIQSVASAATRLRRFPT